MGFQQNEAFGGVGPVEPATVLGFHDRIVIEVRLIAKQRKLEARLAADRPMAIRVRAPRLGEDGDDIFHEAELRFFAGRGRVGHADGECEE
jgi:hypothetical protein